MSFEGENFDYGLYNSALWNAVTSIKFMFKLWSMHETFREKSWSTLKNSNIVSWKYIFLLLEEILTLIKNFQKTIETKFKNFFVKI